MIHVLDMRVRYENLHCNPFTKLKYIIDFNRLIEIYLTKLRNLFNKRTFFSENKKKRLILSQNS